MLQKNFVIYTLDKVYGKKLLEMAINQKKNDINFYLFHEVEELAELAREQELYYLILGDEIPIENRSLFKAEKTFLLQETSAKGGEGDETVIPIFKYQKGESILEEIYLETRAADKKEEKLTEEVLAREALIKESQVKISKKRDPKKSKRQRGEGLSKEIDKEDREGKVIGIYSPIHRIGKTKFAIQLGKDMAKQENVLYLNLEPFAKGGYFEGKEEGDLSDLLYLGSQESQNLGLCISVMVSQIGKLDYIKPMPFMEDLYQVEGSMWKELITKMLEHSIYQTIILDISDGVRDLFEVLDFCDTVYTLYIEEPTAKEKLKQYTDNLIKTGYDSVLEHTIQKKVELVS